MAKAQNQGTCVDVHPEWTHGSIIGGNQQCERLAPGSTFHSSCISLFLIALALLTAGCAPRSNWEEEVSIAPGETVMVERATRFGSAGAIGSLPHTPKESRYECAGKKLSVVETIDNEDTTTRVTVLDRNGEVALYPSISSPGVLLLLCSQGRFAILDTSLHYRPGPSFLMSTDLRMIARLMLGEIDAVDKSKDERIFWVQSFSAIDRKPVTIVTVFSVDGEKVAAKTFTEAAKYAVRYKGVTYSIDVMQPELPG